jgi:hypothetical protein
MVLINLPHSLLVFSTGMMTLCTKKKREEMPSPYLNAASQRD